MGAKYIAIEGPIGVGKTTLARLLADRYGGRLVLEDHVSNPFLTDFYKDRRRYAFQVQIYFLLSRFRQQQEFLSGELLASRVVADFFFGKDRIFAELNLNRDELALYDHVAAMLEKNVPLPDLIIYLTASAETLLNRVKTRARDFEKPIDVDYLTALGESYSRYFFHFSGAPLLVINTENVSFADEPAQFEYLLDRIENIKPGTSYLVPLGSK